MKWVLLVLWFNIWNLALLSCEMVGRIVILLSTGWNTWASELQLWRKLLLQIQKIEWNAVIMMSGVCVSYVTSWYCLCEMCFSWDCFPMIFCFLDVLFFFLLWAWISALGDSDRLISGNYIVFMVFELYMLLHFRILLESWTGLTENFILIILGVKSCVRFWSVKWGWQENAFGTQGCENLIIMLFKMGWCKSSGVQCFFFKS